MSAISFGRRLGSNFFWSGVGESGSRAFLLLFHIYAARVLSVENFGIFSLAQSLVTYLWLGVDLGINFYGPREIAKDRPGARAVINSLLGLRLLSGIAVFGLYALAVFFAVGDPEKRTVYTICAVYLVTRALNAEWAMRGLEWFRKMAIANFATFLLMFGAALLFAKSRDSVSAVAASWSLSYLAGAAVMLRYLAEGLKGGISFSVSPSGWLTHLRESMQFTFASSLTILYYYLPILLLGVFGTERDVGVFSASFRLIMALGFVMGTASLVLMPTITEFYYNDRKGLRKLMTLYCAGAAVLGALAVMILLPAAAWIIRLVYGERYMDAAPTLRILSVFICALSIKAPFQLLLAVAGRQKYNTMAGAASLIAYAVLFYSMVSFGLDVLTAASVSLLATEAFILACVLFVSRKEAFGNEVARQEEP